jgi:Holliday junction resolvase RusA-like endonuclease
MKQTFVVPVRLASFNDYQRENRRNKYAGARFKKQQQEIVELCILQSRLTPFTAPVRVSILWVEKDKRRDPDNVYGAVKWLADALVAMRIIPDDSSRWIKSITHEIMVDKLKPRVEITLEEFKERGN